MAIEELQVVSSPEEFRRPACGGCRTFDSVTSSVAVGRRPTGAFTLIELLVVMGIMILLMTIASLSWTGMRRGAEIRGASATVRTALMLARQQAILRRQSMTVRIDDDGTKSYIATYTSTSTAYAASSTGSIHATASLSPGVQFYPTSSLPIYITFMPNGGSGDSGKTLITVRERAGLTTAPQSVTLTNWNLTGITE